MTIISYGIKVYAANNINRRGRTSIMIRKYQAVKKNQSTLTKVLSNQALKLAAYVFIRKLGKKIGRTKKKYRMTKYDTTRSLG